MIMKNKNKVYSALLIAFSGVVIGLLGNLMPDEFKSKVRDFTSQNLGVSFTVIWIITVALVVLIFIIFTRKEAKDSTSTDEISPESSTKVVQEGDKSIYAGHDVFITYSGDRKIPHHLTPPPFLPEYFIGRDDDLERIHNKLFTGNNLLLLVNGEGGVGKTAVASKYFHKYQQEYRHVAWVLSENSIADALLRLAPKLGLTFGEQMNTDDRLDALAAALAELEKPCLLIVDNANELPDFELHYQRLRNLTKFHLLLTTRITNFQLAETCAIAGLPKVDALALFEEYYRALQSDEQELFYKLTINLDFIMFT